MEKKIVIITLVFAMFVLVINRPHSGDKSFLWELVIFAVFGIIASIFLPPEILVPPQTEK